MIDQVTIKNFKCLRDVTVRLERFTVFVGANGSGKTSILSALDLLCRTFRVDRANHMEESYRSLRSFGSDQEVELSCFSGLDEFRYRTSMTIPMGEPMDHSVHGATIENKSNDEDRKQWNSALGMLPFPVWLRLDPNHLRTSQQGRDIRTMQNDGQGMHRALSSMLLERRRDFFQLEEELSKIVPSVLQLQPTAEHEIKFDTVNGKSLSASQVSEGTLLTLGLLTAIHSVNRPDLLLLDDLDRALHPRAQWELIGLLRGVLETNPNLQIVATTHSPYLLDKMEPQEVRVTSLLEDGSTACEELTEHPKYSKWKDEFYPGEMWSAVGEDWVTKPVDSQK